MRPSWEGRIARVVYGVRNLLIDLRFGAPLLGVKRSAVPGQAGVVNSDYSLYPHVIPTPRRTCRPTLGLRRSRFVRRFDAIEPGGRSVPEVQEVGNWIADNEPLRRWVAVLGDDLPCHKLLHGVAPQVRSPVCAPTAPERLDAIYDKWSFHGLVADVEGVRVPHSGLVPSRETDAAAIAAAIGYPLLVKPLTGKGGHGISRVSDERQLKADLATRDADGFPVKLQRFIRGPTLGLSLLAREGRILASDVQLHRSDGAREIVDDHDVQAMGGRIVEALSYGGPGHIDFVRDAATGDLYAIEFNCRFWGSVEVSMWLGGNFPALAVDVAQGRAVALRPTSPGFLFQAGAAGSRRCVSSSGAPRSA